MTNKELIDALQSEPADREVRYQEIASGAFHTIEGLAKPTLTEAITVLHGSEIAGLGDSVDAK